MACIKMISMMLCTSLIIKLLLILRRFLSLRRSNCPFANLRRLPGEGRKFRSYRKRAAGA
jgi:hypothetical protein